MPEPTVTIARARYETLMRMALAAHEGIGALLAGFQAEITDEPTDPRAAKGGRPNTFGTPST